MRTILATLVIFFSIQAQSFAGSTIANVELDLDLVPQTQTNWCWAAATSMVASYYSKREVPQCEIASSQYGMNCCVNPRACNQANSVMDFVPLLRQFKIKSKVVRGRLNWDQLKRNIDAGKPLIIRVGWYGNQGGHFVVIYGYRLYRQNNGDIHKSVWIKDPSYGYINMETASLSGMLEEWESLRNNNTFGGQWADWSHTVGTAY